MAVRVCLTNAFVDGIVRAGIHIGIQKARPKATVHLLLFRQRLHKRHQLRGIRWTVALAASRMSRQGVYVTSEP